MFTQIPFHVLVGWNKNQEPQKKDGKTKLKISRSNPRTKTQWDSMEKQLNSSGQILPRFTTLTIVQEIQKDSEEKNIQPENFKDRIIFMSMFRDILWTSGRRPDNAKKVKNYAKKFLTGHWTFLGPGSEKRCFGDSHGGQLDHTANKMVQQFKETGHPLFTSTSALSRGILKQRRGKSTIHFNGDSVKWNSYFKQFSL